MRRYRDTSPKAAAAEILSDIVQDGSSSGWAGSHEELDAMRAILRGFNVAYTDDMSGTWERVTP